MRINERYDLSEIARRLQAAKTPDRAGSFQAYELEMGLSVLETCVDFQPEIPEADRRGVIFGAVAAAAEAGDVTRGALTDALRRAEVSYLRRPLQEYVLLSSLTVTPFRELRRLRVGAATLTFSGHVPQRFSRRQVQDDIDRVTAVNAHWLLNCRTHVRARTPLDAFNRAQIALDYVRALWNFRVNERTLMRSSWSTRLPVNEIRYGPVHTLHFPGGKLARDSVWYEPRDQQTDRRFALAADWPRTRKWSNVVRRRISESPYGDKLRELLIRYVRALDLADHEVAFNKLWAVLEHLTGSVGEYAKLVDRVSFIYAPSDYNYMRLTLEHLRDVRNGLVHYDQSRGGIQTYVYQLKAFVEALFRFHWSMRLDSFTDAIDLLSLPTDPRILEQRITLLARARKFRS